MTEQWPLTLLCPGRNFLTLPLLNGLRGTWLKYEGLNIVNREPTNDQTINRQLAVKKAIFLPSTVNKPASSSRHDQMPQISLIKN